MFGGRGRGWWGEGEGKGWWVESGEEGGGERVVGERRRGWGWRGYITSMQASRLGDGCRRDLLNHVAPLTQTNTL